MEFRVHVDVGTLGRSIVCIVCKLPKSIARARLQNSRIFCVGRECARSLNERSGASVDMESGTRARVSTLQTLLALRAFASEPAEKKNCFAV